MKEASEKRATHILDIEGQEYALDSTTIPLCLATFLWARFRSKKGGVKVHVLYDIGAQVPVYFIVTTASKHDSTAISAIHYYPNAYYILIGHIIRLRNYIGFILRGGAKCMSIQINMPLLYNKGSHFHKHGPFSCPKVLKQWQSYIIFLTCKDKPSFSHKESMKILRIMPLCES